MEFWKVGIDSTDAGQNEFFKKIMTKNHKYGRIYNRQQNICSVTRREE